MNIKHLAKALDLSFSTVSKALRDSYEISPATKLRVMEKAKELHYEVNHFGSSLRLQKSKTIAVVVPEIECNFFGPVVNGVESIAHVKGYHVLVYLTHENMDKEVSIARLLQNGRVDGILMSVSARTDNTQHLEELKEKQIPLVFFDRVIHEMDVPSVCSNDYQSAYMGTEHLIKNGCGRIGFLAVSKTLSISKSRLDGYLDAIKKHRIKPDVSLIGECFGGDEKNKKTIQTLLTGNNPPDAIFATVEKLAFATYELCHELNLRIPEDLKVLSYSNSNSAPLLNPSLSTIAQPAFEMGRESASMLFELAERKIHPFHVEKTILNSKLIPRNSTKLS